MSVVWGPAGTEAASVRVVLHNQESDQGLIDQRRMMRRRGMKTLAIAGPLILIGVALRVLVLVHGAETDTRNFVIAMLITVVLIAGGTWLLLRRQKRRALDVEGGVWMSKGMLFAGPHDDTSGLIGSRRFAARHRRNTPQPIVRLVMTNEGFQIVPSYGKRETLSCLFSELATVDVSLGGGRTGGVTLTTKDGRSASFSGRTDYTVVEALNQRGATLQAAT